MAARSTSARAMRTARRWAPGRRQHQRQGAAVGTRPTDHQALGLETVDEAHTSGGRQRHRPSETIDRPTVEELVECDQRRRCGAGQSRRPLHPRLHRVGQAEHHCAEHVDQVIVGGRHVVDRTEVGHAWSWVVHVSQSHIWRNIMTTEITTTFTVDSWDEQPIAEVEGASNSPAPSSPRPTPAGSTVRRPRSG